MQQSFWVKPAKSPEDYIYENISCSRSTRIARLVGAEARDKSLAGGRRSDGGTKR